VIADGSVKQVVQRKLQRLPFDVPKRHVEGTLAMDLLTPRRVETIHLHVMPDLFDVERALPIKLLQDLDQVRRSFADARNADVATVTRSALWRTRVGAGGTIYTRDLALGARFRACGERAPRAGRRKNRAIDSELIMARLSARVADILSCGIVSSCACRRSINTQRGAPMRTDVRRRLPVAAGILAVAQET
jgi:hypothetical protein